MESLTNEIYDSALEVIREVMPITVHVCIPFPVPCLDQAAATKSVVGLHIPLRDTPACKSEGVHAKFTADKASAICFLCYAIQVEELGGMAKAVESGMPKLRIEEAAAKKQVPPCLSEQIL